MTTWPLFSYVLSSVPGRFQREKTAFSAASSDVPEDHLPITLDVPADGDGGAEMAVPEAQTQRLDLEDEQAELAHGEMEGLGHLAVVVAAHVDRDAQFADVAVEDHPRGAVAGFPSGDVLFATRRLERALDDL